MVDFRIGRLHAMAYAQNVDAAPCDANASRGSKYELPDFGHEPDHIQFKVSSQNINSAAAKEHLKKAIVHLEKATKIDPSLYTARLGLAWCLEQSGDKTKALELYRQVFAHTFEGEKNAKGGPSNWSIAEETAIYLKPMLDPVKDRKELEQIRKQETQLAKLPHYVTPLMIPLTSGLALKDLLRKNRVRYDLDGFGVREYSEWIGPQAAWVVLNRDGKGNIDSGIKLIGQSSFWLFWQNAYEVLRGLDDNHDGQLTGKELDGLAIWQDKNANGISEPGEIKTLAQSNITALNVSAKRDAAGLLWNSKGVVLKNGTTLASYDVVLKTTNKSYKNIGAAAAKIQQVKELPSLR